MRAKVAAHAGGHAFEQRFLDLDLIQLRILFEHVRAEERKQKNEKIEFTKTLNEIWVNNFNEWFKTMSFYSNPEVFKKVQDLKKELETELEQDKPLNEDNFGEIWNDLLQHIPSEVQVNIPEEQEMNQAMSPEIQDLVVGWIPFDKRFKGGE